MKIKDELFQTIFGGRYIIILMGGFSVYTGLIYNDVFSKSINLFSSSWYPEFDLKTIHANPVLQLEPRVSENITDQMYSGMPYPFGLDPVWQLSANKIPLTNSLKMKISVILGVAHMVFGICLSFCNHGCVGL